MAGWRGWRTGALAAAAVAGAAALTHRRDVAHARAVADALLAAREVVQVLYGQWALRHGIDLRVNWPGRLAVLPVMSSIFFALCGLETLGEILLYVGLFFAIWATVLYIREGSTSD